MVRLIVKPWRLWLIAAVLITTLGWPPIGGNRLNRTIPEQPGIAFAESNKLPVGFVYLDRVAPEIILEIRYSTDYNFAGTQIDGYRAARAILTEPAATALRDVNAELKAKGYRLKIYDAYRPQRAVSHFARWAKDPADNRMKAMFYPKVDKKDLFRLGYIASKSGHSRGSTVDLTLVDAATGQEIDMGSSFDFFGAISHHDTNLIAPEQARNRNILKEAMVNHGFKPYLKEWWHYTLANEPFPDTYFDFPVE